MESKILNPKALLSFQKRKGWFSGSSVNWRPLACLKQEWKSGTQPVLKSWGAYHEPSHKETSLRSNKQLGTFLLMRILSCWQALGRSIFMSVQNHRILCLEPASQQNPTVSDLEWQHLLLASTGTKGTGAGTVLTCNRKQPLRKACSKSNQTKRKVQGLFLSYVWEMWYENKSLVRGLTWSQSA